MAKKHLTDAEAKTILVGWPRLTEKLWPPPTGKGYWIRASIALVTLVAGFADESAGYAEA